MKYLAYLLAFLPLFSYALWDNGDEYEMRKVRQQMEQDKLNRYSYDEAAKSVDESREKQRERMKKGNGHLAVSPTRTFKVVEEVNSDGEIIKVKRQGLEVPEAEAVINPKTDQGKADDNVIDFFQIFLLVAMFAGIGWLRSKHKSILADNKA